MQIWVFKMAPIPTELKCWSEKTVQGLEVEVLADVESSKALHAGLFGFSARWYTLWKFHGTAQLPNFPPQQQKKVWWLKWKKKFSTTALHESPQLNVLRLGLFLSTLEALLQHWIDDRSGSDCEKV